MLEIENTGAQLSVRTGSRAALSSRSTRQATCGTSFLDAFKVKING